MSVFDVAKNNRGNDEIGIYTSYARFDEYLRMAQAEERERIIALLEAWVNDDNGDFDATLALIKGDNK